jgi:hypothetical protein
MSESFGVWELLTRLGQNELGETHLALRRSDQRKAVLKRFSAVVRDDASFYEPLKLELGLAATLQHASAAAVLEQGEVDGVAFAALECVDGISLTKLIRAAKATGGWPLSIERATTLMRPVLDALHAAHALKPPLLHRDLVPENVLVTCEGRVVVTDFGLGRARRRAGNAAGGMRRAYVSPEQARGNAIAQRSEVFCAGLMLFELVCGRLPVDGDAGEVISRIATGELDAPLSVNPQLDPGAAAVLQRALALRPEDRFASAGEFFEALAPFAASKEEALGAWVSRLDSVKVVAAPPSAPKPSAPAVPAPVEAAPTVVAPIAVPVTSPPHRWVRRAAWGGVAACLLALLQTQIDWPALLGTTEVDPLSAGRPLELTSIPSGAQVYVDGVLEDRRTPLTLVIPKDEVRNVLVRKQGFGQWSGYVANTHKLEVTLANGGLVEVRYEGARPAPKEKAEPEGVIEVPAPEPASPTPAPVRDVAFDAESPPLDVLLTAAHSVRADIGVVTDIPAGVDGSLIQGATVYNAPSVSAYGRNAAGNRGKVAYPNTAGTGSFRYLGVFAFKNEDDVLELVDLNRPVTFKGGKYHLLIATEGGSLSVPPELKVAGVPVPLARDNVLRVDQDDSFLIRVLNPLVTYRLELTRADGSKEPLPPILMSMRSAQPDRPADNDPESSPLRFDGEPIPTGQVIVRDGKHTFSGARSAWFTIVTATGVVPPDLKLSVTLPKKKLR